VTHRVAVTGMGVVCAIGATLPEFRAALVAGRSGVGPITIFDPASLPTRIAAEVKTSGVMRDRKVTFACQAAARIMIPQGGGRIINIGSVTSVAGYAGLGPYGASRGGIRQLTMSLADDWGPYGITVNCLAPGWFRTEQNKVMYEDREWVEYLCDRIPLKRPGQPEDLGGPVVFLASESSRYITGQTLLVDGGISTGATRALPKKS